jgi:peptidoglycan/LPS O-acetylase OafA/YrhL
MLNNAKEHRFTAVLDGLRVFAILFVAAYHFSLARGGFLGVDIFFVLSGYLVTLKILVLQENEPDFNLIKFWGGRAQRLLPDANAMIITTFVWVTLFNRELLSKLWGDTIASIFYLTNWWFIFHKLSYFDSFGAPSPLKHLWFCCSTGTILFCLANSTHYIAEIF